MTQKVTQLSNVAFGGDWSENLLEQFETTTVLKVLREAVETCQEEDPRGQSLLDAIEHLKSSIDKGEDLANGLLKALDKADPVQRQKEALRYLELIERHSGGRYR
ncbi:hypothetical protein [Pseudovibrio sp. Alg231-02]|uniref:hypothetical protein n=1 Tax=Pseudovibrio sp. Alg231-02 TaxID=1922223 RepID=UPI00131EDBA7|nr:hypothetical protein [Pseudovibrio sp. Alg231-02]